mgnify:CR=1 FL=1
MCAPPLNALVASQCNIPFSMVATPFADPEGPIEKQVPIVKSQDNSPVRCTRCRGYINCHVTWLDNGSQWACNLCGMANAVQDWYYSSLDGTGLRVDRLDRPELTLGSVDFLVGQDYSMRPLGPHGPRLKRNKSTAGAGAGAGGVDGEGGGAKPSGEGLFTDLSKMGVYGKEKDGGEYSGDSMRPQKPVGRTTITQFYNPSYAFAVDISPRAIACGATMASFQAVESCVRGLEYVVCSCLED